MALKHHLFCYYDPYVRPVLSHKEVNNVTIKLIPKILEFVSLSVSRIRILVDLLQCFDCSSGRDGKQDGAAQLDDLGK